MARRSLDLWQQIAGLDGWHPAGVLWLAAGDDPYTAATKATLEASGYPVEVLSGSALTVRYPQFAAADIGLALLEPEGGVLMARRLVQRIAGLLQDQRVALLRGRVRGVVSAGDGVRVTGDIDVTADAVVCACGAWLPTVFPDLLAGRIRPTRQVVMYFGTPPGDTRFDAAHTPAWVDFPSGIYGVPDIEGRGLKIGIDAHGEPFDPDCGDRTPDPASVAQARAWLARRMPAMAGAPVVETRVCQYENTATGDFLIDRHPAHAQVVLVGGGSGHGFKHGPVVGELAARLVLDAAAAPEPRFALATKDAAARRAVY